MGGGGGGGVWGLFPSMEGRIRDHACILTKIVLCLAGFADWSGTCCYCCCVFGYMVEFRLLPKWNLLFKELATCGYLCWPRKRY